eukprot:scaffold84765_cov15-Prasinocladus_malaysianus.AAC.1
MSVGHLSPPKSLSRRERVDSPSRPDGCVVKEPLKVGVRKWQKLYVLECRSETENAVRKCQ